uniref:hypothetical protein n=1 Tax=Pedobacter schmidteae TaxID=2201271 RepID=UPI0013CED998|nr:hypothetical protein [Pedobacter schmidteae]
MFTWEMGSQSDAAIDSWNFQVKDTTFRITKWNQSDDYSIAYSTDRGSSTSFIDGKCLLINDTLFLKNDTAEMYIYRNKLYDFRNSKTPVSLKFND